jgi:hypothetical protein
MGDMTPIHLSIFQYDEIQKDLRGQHGIVSIIQSWKKRELGWTPAVEHQYHQNMRVRIDFWDPDAKTLFLLRYFQYVSV